MGIDIKLITELLATVITKVTGMFKLAKTEAEKDHEINEIYQEIETKLNNTINELTKALTITNALS